jgi:branched-chain amino acid transport system substrate-binding protein
VFTRRTIGRGLVGAIAAATLSVPAQPARAEGTVVKVGVDMSLTGADVTVVQRFRDAILLAFEGANQSHAVPGVRIEPIFFDDASATAGQSDPAQGATNARKMVLDKDIVAALGPMANGVAKAMEPILSAGNLATVSGIATNPDLTDPRSCASPPVRKKPIGLPSASTRA